MEPDTRTYDGWIGRDAYDADADRVGEITDIYYDDASGRPEWVTVKTGLFGMKRTFVPIHGSAPCGEGDLRLAYDKGTIKDAPVSIPRSTCRLTKSGSCGPTTDKTTPT
jgi:PRC-barrel domain